MARPVLAVLAALALAAAGCDQPQPNLPEPPRPARAAPPWLPPYSAAQLALLEPEGGRPRTPAARVYPDLSRFTYVRPRKLEDPTEAMRFLRVVLGVIEESPRVYLLGDAAASLANEVAQYGPPPPLEPDGLVIARPQGDGSTRLERAPGADAAGQALDRAADLVTAGRRPEALAALRAAAGAHPGVPALHVELGELLARDDAEAAERAFTRALALDDTLASAHVGLAAMLLARGDHDGGQIAIARALALHPPSTRAQHLAALAAPADGPPRPRPFSIFLDVDAHGAVRAATDGTLPARSYAGCRAIVRYEPEVRELLHGVAEPYHLGLVEEVVCLEAALGAYLVHREGGGGAADPALDALLAIARTEGLAGYAMFEILGRHRPERARTAPHAVHQATVTYILRHVLGAPALEDQRTLALGPAR